MKLLKIQIENFMCYKFSIIDFTLLKSAVIVGKRENNDLFANGIGKTTIYKAIEYVIFNQVDSKLENIINDDSAFCKVILDFEIDGKKFRISRTRTRKGSADLSLFEEKYSESEDESWKDISGRRAQDTEKDLNKLIKINFKSFRSTIHFVQNDFSGLTTASPEKRKNILREALNILIYSKLEKIAKDKSSISIKEMDKLKLMISNRDGFDNDIQKYTSQLVLENTSLEDIKRDICSIQKNIDDQLDFINKLASSLLLLEENNKSLIVRDKKLSQEKIKIEKNVNEYLVKKNNNIKDAKILINEVKKLKQSILEIDCSKFDEVNKINAKILSCKEEIAECNGNLKILNSKDVELSIPIPSDEKCRHCRQTLSKNHRQECENKIKEELIICKNDIKKLNDKINSLKEIINLLEIDLNSISVSKKQYDLINSKTLSLNKEIEDKKASFKEYSDLYNKFVMEQNEIENEFISLKKEFEKSSINECEILRQSIIKEKDNLSVLQKKLFDLNSILNKNNSSIAIIEHTIREKQDGLKKRQELQLKLADLEKKYESYPLVLQAFSSTGIPNLIIQNVLNDLQVEANLLLSKLKPELQLSFIVEKTKGDGSQDDTLDIKYFVNGKDRDYELLSGAMKFCVNLSLKLGLSFLIQKMIGVNIKFLLLDEIDQSLDKASIDTLSSIIKDFHNEYTILVITHNDRLKDHFSSAIMVEQDSNMVSTAKIVNQW
jgi:DNA repair exonuclease SbcCD ATPase subunit